MSSGSRAIVGAVGLGVVAAALVIVGRWYGGRDVRSENRGIAAVAGAVGRLDAPSPSGYRVFPSFDCLTYRRGGNALALELCVDETGRVVEAIDRRGAVRTSYGLRFDRAAATVRVDRRQVDGLLRRLGATP